MGFTKKAEKLPGDFVEAGLLARFYRTIVTLCKLIVVPFCPQRTVYLDSLEAMIEPCAELQAEGLLGMDLEFCNGGRFQVWSGDNHDGKVSMEGGFTRWPMYLQERWGFIPAQFNINGPFAVLLGLAAPSGTVYIFDLRVGFPLCLRELLDDMAVTKLLWDRTGDEQAMLNTVGYRFNGSVKDLQLLAVQGGINDGQRAGLNLSMNMFYKVNLDKSLQGSGQHWNMSQSVFRNHPRGKLMLRYLAKDCLSVLLLSGAIWFHYPEKLDPELRFKVGTLCFH